MLFLVRIRNQGPRQGGRPGEEEDQEDTGASQRHHLPRYI